MTIELEPSKLVAARGLFAQRQNEIVSTIRRLVEYESPSGDTDGSAAVNQLLVEVSGRIPAIDSIELIDSPDCGRHLLIRAFSNQKGKRTTLLLGHTDTVHPVGTATNANPIRLDGDCLFGPGIFDMNASCVLALEVLRCLDMLSLRPARPVTLLLTCDEETGSRTGRTLVERESRAAAQVLVLEPPGRCKMTFAAKPLRPINISSLRMSSGLCRQTLR